MNKIYFILLVLIASTTTGQTVITQWNFDNLVPVTAKLPTTGAGIFTLIGGVQPSVGFPSGLMPAGNPATGKAYKINSFPEIGAASGKAGFQFKMSTVGITGPISVSFDVFGTSNSSRWQQYEYSINGTDWNVLGNNDGRLSFRFMTSPMVILTLPASCSDNPNFAFRIVSIFAPGNSIYEPVFASENYRNFGTWTIDNVTFSTSSLSVNQNSIAGLNIYPNPARNNKVYITSKNNTDKSILIFDNLGKKVLQTTINTKELNISSLSAGVYTINVKENEATATRKLIVQ
jgi:hypothetical protein